MTDQQTADTLFAFQMALNGHKQFEWKSIEGDWLKTDSVSSGLPHRIYHDIPEGWTRHDGDEWKGDPRAVIEEVIICDGRVSKGENSVGYWSDHFSNSFTRDNHALRIYAYKLAKPAVIEKKVVPWDFASAPLNAKVKRKSDGKIFRMASFPDDVVLCSTTYATGDYCASYETLAADYLQLNGEVCGTEEV